MYRKFIFACRLSAQICAVCLLLTAVLRAQNVADNGQGSQNQYKLSGTVVNGVTGEPIRRALVQIFEGQAVPVLTDAEGRFEFDDLAQGRFNLNVRKPGYFNEYEVTGGARQTQVNVGPDTFPITLKLFPEAAIFGHVESNGEPVENLPMKVMAVRINNGRKFWMRQAGVMTDADGAFRITGLTPGTYYLSAGPHWERIASGAVPFDKGFAEIFFDNADDVTSATPIQVIAGQQVEANFSVKSPSLFHISGTINVLPGQSANLMLLNWAGEPVQVPTHFIPEKGEFQAAVPSGAYTLQAQSFGQNSAPMTATIPLHITSDISGIRLVLAPAITIPVNVQKQKIIETDDSRYSASFSGVDARGKFFTMTEPGGGIARVGLIPTDLSLQNRNFFSTYRAIGNTHQLEIENVDPGKYYAEISVEGSNWYALSAQCGSVDLLHEDLVVAPGSQPAPIEVVIRNDAATLEGQVSSGGQMRSATVLVIPDGAPTRTREFSAFGHYEMSGFAPGNYSVLAVDNAQNLEYANPEVIAPYLSRAQHVSLQSNQKTEVNLEPVQVSKQ